MVILGIDIINMTGILLVCFYAFAKSINYIPSTNYKWIFALWCVSWAFLYAISFLWIPMVIFLPILCAISIVFIWRLNKIKLDTVISAFLLSFGVSYSLLGITSALVGLVFAPFFGIKYANDLIDFNEPLDLLLTFLVACLQLLFAFLLFKIKRFRNGFPFLFKKYSVILALVVAGIILVLVSLLIIPKESGVKPYFFFPLLIGIIIVGAGIIIWIRSGIKAFYKRKLKEHSVELYEQDLAEKEHAIQQLTEQNDALRGTIHKTNHRLAALERSVGGLLQEIPLSSETSEELASALEDIKRLSKDFQNDISLVKGETNLPSTKIKMLDNLLEYFAEQCTNNKIDFILKVSGSILYMVEHMISQSKLETIIGDHLQNALIAVNASENSFRCILAILGLSENDYELSIFDSGIPFEIDTLARLGKEHVTTHANIGGSGIGFMTTFEVMQEYEASLIINEKKPSNTDFTKSVTVRFDGKNQYVIETYRPDDFSDQSGKLAIVGHGN